MELDFDKYCVVDRSPTTVLPATRRSSKVSSRKSTKNGNDVLKLNKDFAEINFNRYRSASCRDVRSRRSNHECNEVLKRGSVYQSSKEATLLKRTDSIGGRKKIEFSRASAKSTSSFGIIDSLCSSDEDGSITERNRSSVMSLSEQSTSSVCKHDGKSLLERDLAVNLHKSLSVKLSLPHSPARSESDGSKPGSPKARFSPMKKMFEPFVKSKSHRSPLSCVNETAPETLGGPVGKNCNKTICKSLLNDLSDKPDHVEYNSQCEKKENCNSALQCSPTHLHGVLKMENKNGVPHFQFSVKSPEDVYVAKAWKVENALTWVYTFHALHHRRKSNASGRGFKDSNKETTIIGQMHVSSYLCTELKGGGAFNDSMVTEFVLYDIAHSRRSVSSQGNSTCSPVSHEISSSGNCEQHEILAKTKTKGHFESSPSKPHTAADLYPELEVAAIVMQVPFEKRESLKFKSGDRKTDKRLPNLLDLCQLENPKKGISDISSSGKMHVVIPAGNHSLASSESRGPSPILDRWRLGGGCDCGGWDMACPLNVFGNSNIRIAENQALMDEQHPTQLFIQGRKDNIAGFSMRVMEDGKYAVDFHAQLSSLQAFSICVAILHAAEASTAVGHERSKQMLQSDSLRVFAEEEIKNLIDVISEDEKFKVGKKIVEVMPSFVLNPPFSPISRV